MLAKLVTGLLFVSLNALAVTPTELLVGYTAQSGQSANVAKGEAFFKASHGQAWQCTSCHGESPTVGGRHASTDKAIEPLAPAANAKRLTDRAKVEKWFRRNCQDVLARECTAAEKADVLAWLMTLR
jgi:cytochrome c553